MSSRPPRSSSPLRVRALEGLAALRTPAGTPAEPPSGEPPAPPPAPAPASSGAPDDKPGEKRPWWYGVSVEDLRRRLGPMGAADLRALHEEVSGALRSIGISLRRPSREGDVEWRRRAEVAKSRTVEKLALVRGELQRRGIAPLLTEDQIAAIVRTLADDLFDRADGLALALRPLPDTDRLEDYLESLEEAWAGKIAGLVAREDAWEDDDPEEPPGGG